MVLKEFYLDGPGVILSARGYIIRPQVAYKSGRKIYLLRPGKYQVYYSSSNDNMSSEAIKNSIRSDIEGFNIVNVIVTRHLIIYEKPSFIFRIDEKLLEDI